MDAVATPGSETRRFLLSSSEPSSTTLVYLEPASEVATRCWLTIPKHRGPTPRTAKPAGLKVKGASPHRKGHSVHQRGDPHGRVVAVHTETHPSVGLGRSWSGLVSSLSGRQIGSYFDNASSVWGRPVPATHDRRQLLDAPLAIPNHRDRITRMPGASLRTLRHGTTVSSQLPVRDLRTSCSDLRSPRPTGLEPSVRPVTCNTSIPAALKLALKSHQPHARATAFQRDHRRSST
jgi:hypothetical protein